MKYKVDFKSYLHLSKEQTDYIQSVKPHSISIQTINTISASVRKKNDDGDNNNNNNTNTIKSRHHIQHKSLIKVKVKFTT